MAQTNRNFIGKLRKAAENDDPIANVRMAHYYLDIIKNEELALKYFERARLLGDSYVSLRIGEIYIKKEDFITALKRIQEVNNVDEITAEYKEMIDNFYDELASAGDKKVLKYLADRFDKNEEYINAYRWYVELKDVGDGDVLYKLGIYYLNGRGVKKDEAKAFECFSIGYDQGNTDCGEMLISLFFNGIGTDKDHDKAKAIASKLMKNKVDLNLRTLAQIEEENGQFKEATKHYIESVEKFNDEQSVLGLIRLAANKNCETKSLEFLVELLYTIKSFDAADALNAYKVLSEGKLIPKDENKALFYLDMYLTSTGFINKNEDLVTKCRDLAHNIDNDSIEYFYCKMMIKHYGFNFKKDDKYKTRYKTLEKKVLRG